MKSNDFTARHFSRKLGKELEFRSSGPGRYVRMLVAGEWVQIAEEAGCFFGTMMTAPQTDAEFEKDLLRWVRAYIANYGA